MRRFLHVAKWVGAAPCAVVVLAWCFAALGGTWAIGNVALVNEPQLKIADGALWVNLGVAWVATQPPQPKYLHFLRVPFPVILVPLAIVTALFWLAGREGRPAHHCQRCGYNLTGNVSGTCPECGATILPADAKPG